MKKRDLQRWWEPMFAVGLLSLFVLSFFSQPHSGTDDDWVFSYLIAGKLGSLGMSPYLNPALSEMLKALAQAMPSINVYEVFRVTMVMVAFTAVFLCLFHLMQPSCAFAVSSLLVFIYWNDTMLEYNFTYTAGLCAFAGILLLYCFLIGRMHLKAAVCGSALWLIGFAWRWESAILLVPYLAVLLAFYGVQAWKNAKCKKRDHLQKAVPGVKFYSLAALAVLMLIMAAYAQWFWSRPGWSEYIRFDNARSAAVDFTLAPWGQAKNELEPLGLTENDYWCAQNWVIADPEVFTLERVEAIAEQKVASDHGGSFITQALQYVVKAPFRVRACSAFFLIALFALFTAGISQWLAILCAIGGSYAISLYFLWQGRLIDRVEAIIWLGAICVVVAQVRPFCCRGKNAVKIICGVVGAFFLITTGWRTFPLTAQNGLFQAAYAVKDPTIQATINSGNHYIWGIMPGGEVWKNAYGNVHLPDEDFFEHNSWLGGWTENSPFQKQLRKQIGLENPIKALVENETVHFVDTYRPEKILKFIQEHYAPKAALSAAEELGENIWALKITLPIKGEEVKVLDWSLEELTPVNGEPTGNWYIVSGEAKKIEGNEALWLRIQDRLGETRCYRLINQGEGRFGTGLYLDWAQPNADLECTLLWQKDGKLYGSMDQKVRSKR